jgi:hypothetical protein
MGRPKKKGLDYFPIDTDIFQDEKMQLVFARFGPKADSIAFRLWSRIYNNSYFLPWNEKAEIIFCNQFGKHLSIKTLHAVIEEFLNCELLHREIYEAHGILTSSGIQRRYEFICKQLHRQSAILEAHKINSEETPFNSEETQDQPYRINSEETPEDPPINSEKSTQIKENKRKENKIKIKESDSSENRGNSHSNNLINNSNGSEEITDADKELYRTFYPGK